MSHAVCVKARDAQAVRKLLEDNQLWDCSRKLQKDGNVIAVPIYDDVAKSQLSKLLEDFPDAEVREMALPPSAKSVRTTECQRLKAAVRSLLRNKNLSESLLQEIPRKWERHGDLILLPSSSFVSPQWSLLGDELWQTVASVLSCRRLARYSIITNDGYRTPKVSMLLGHDGKVVHIDNGIKYSFDVTKCMFSSGNITEKLRVASWDCSNETVVDLYAGIGYFTLPYLVHAKAKHVHACEWNPDAVEALKCNLSLNGVEDRCTVHQGDNRQLKLSCVADRVNLGLIPSSEDGWHVAVRVLKPAGGVLHIHHNVTIKIPPISCVMDDQQIPTETEIHEERMDSCDNSNIFVTNVLSENPHFSQDNGKSPELYENCVPDNIRNLQKDGHHGDCDDDSGAEVGLNCDLAFINKKVNYLPWARGVCKRIESLFEELKGGVTGWQCQILHVEKVKSYAPHIDHVVLDLACKPKGDG